jgi:hypothetical protein
MNLVFGRRDDTGYFSPISDAQLDKAWADAEKARQAKLQSDHEAMTPAATPSTVVIEGIKYEWEAQTRRWMVSHNPHDFASWLREKSKIPYSMTVEQMADRLVRAKLSNGGERHPLELDEKAFLGERAPIEETPQFRTIGDILRTVQERGPIERKSVDQWLSEAKAESTVHARLTTPGPWFISSTETTTDAPDGYLNRATGEFIETDDRECSESNDFEAGDIVELRSGSAHLTIEEVLTECEECGAAVELSVVWWDHDLSTIRRDRVLASSIEHAFSE